MPLVILESTAAEVAALPVTVLSESRVAIYPRASDQQLAYQRFARQEITLLDSQNYAGYLGTGDGGAGLAYISEIGASPTTAAIQAVLDNTAYGTVVFDTQGSITLTGNLAIKRAMLVVVRAGCKVVLPNNYTVNFNKFIRGTSGTFSANGALVGLFHVDTGNNTSGAVPGVTGAKIEIYGELQVGFKNSYRGCGVVARKARDLVVKCPGRIYGAWTGVFLCDCDRPLVGPVNAYSDVIDTGSGPNAAVVPEGCIGATIRDVWAVQYEEAVDHAPNNLGSTVDNVRCSGDFNICMEFASITGTGFQENEVVTDGTTGITGYVTEWDAPHLRLYVKGTAGPFIAGNVMTGATSGSVGTVTRVSTAAPWYVSKLVLTSVVGTPVAGNTVTKGSASGKVALWQSSNSTLWVKEVAGARFTSGSGLSGGGLTSATISTVTDSFQSQNACDISNLEGATFTNIRAHNQYKCLEVFDYPTEALILTLQSGATAPAIGETVTATISGATGVVLWYETSARKIHIGEFTGTFGVGNVVTGGTSGNGGTISAVTLDDHGPYGERFLARRKPNDKGNKIDAVATYDSYWIGTGMSAATPFDISTPDDSDMNLKVIANKPAGDFTKFVGIMGANRIGPPTDVDFPKLESSKIRLWIWSTKAPAIGGKDLVSVVNPGAMDMYPNIISPIAAGFNAIIATRSGTFKYPSKLQIHDPVIVQASFLPTDSLPAAAGTGINIGSVPGQHAISGVPLYYNLVTKETLSTDFVTRNRARRRYVRDFTPSFAGTSVNAGSTKSASVAFTEYSMKALDEIRQPALSFDATQGAGNNTLTMQYRAIGTADGTIRLEAYNPSGSSIAVPSGAQMRITVEKTLGIDAQQIPITALAVGTPTINETVTGGTSGATGVVLWYETVAAAPTTGTIHLAKLLAGLFVAGETLTGGTSGFTATAGTPVYNTL